MIGTITSLTDLTNRNTYGHGTKNHTPGTAANLALSGVDSVELTDRQIADLVDTDMIYWRVVALVPSRAVTAPVKIDFSQAYMPSVDDIDALTVLLREWKQQFYIAQSSAEAYGESFLLINTFREDGAKTAQTTLRPHSVSRLTIVPSTTYLKREGDYYYWPKQPTERGRKRVHASRVLHFVGRQKAGVVPLENAPKYNSMVKRFAFAYQLYTASLALTVSTMANKTTVIFTKKGLDSDIAAADDPQQYVEDTLKPLVKTLTDSGVALLDGRFDATMLARSMTGMHDSVMDMRANMVAKSGLTDSLLFNDTTKASASPGSEDPDEIFLANAVDYLMDTSWCPKLTTLFNLLRPVPELVVRMQSSYKLTATALANIQLTLARHDAIAITHQINTPAEARSRAQGEWTPYMQLDPTYTPPKVPVKVKALTRPAAINRSNVPPNDRDVVDPKTEGMGGKNPKSLADADDQLTDDQLMGYLVGFGKSQPRLVTLQKVQDRALVDGDIPHDRITAFCDAWKFKTGDTDDIDLIAKSRLP